MLVTISFSEFNLKKQVCTSWGFHADERSESSNTYDVINGQGRDLLGEIGIIMNFNDHTVTWDIDTIPMKVRDTGTLPWVEALVEDYMRAIEPQMLRDENSRMFLV
jgi:hypothetical protein